MFDIIFHRILRFPYTLNVRHIRKVKGAKTTLLFIHGIGNSGGMWKKILKSLPSDVSYITIDLLGFGDSPKPSWHYYDARGQARCLLATYLKQNLKGQVLIVGHSLGGLVAVEFAKRYKLLTKQLILCSPPIYDVPSGSNIPKKQEDVLRSIFKKIARDPSFIVNAYEVAQKLKIIESSYSVDEDSVDMFIKTLDASIINQHTIKDIDKLNLPVTIINGLADPLVVRANLIKIDEANKNICMINVPAGHLINAPYAKVILQTITDNLN